MHGSLSDLETALGVTFSNKQLLMRAMTHKSYLNENPSARALGHNERLEFLGDAVLELVVREYLYRNLSDADEGVMTNISTELVQGATLGKLGEQFGLQHYLRLSHGQKKDVLTIEKVRTRLLADAVEAIIGALYLDRQKAAVEVFILETIIPHLEKIQREGFTAWKTELQELVQSLGHKAPTYQILKQEGPAHKKVFTVGVRIGGKIVATAVGNSLKEAENTTAKEALQIFRNLQSR